MVVSKEICQQDFEPVALLVKQKAPQGTMAAAIQFIDNRTERRYQ